MGKNVQFVGGLWEGTSDHLHGHFKAKELVAELIVYCSSLRSKVIQVLISKIHMAFQGFPIILNLFSNHRIIALIYYIV